MASPKKLLKQLKAKFDKKIGRHERVRLDLGEVGTGAWLRMWYWLRGHPVLEFIAENIFYYLIGIGF